MCGSSESERGIVLVNLGSPDSPSTGDVRRYLGEFLMDGRVLDVPYLLRRLIVSGFILPFRPKRSARAYRSIWWDEGSPLIVLSRRMERLIQRRLSEPVELAMRYGNPSIERALRRLIERKPDMKEVFMVPLYPHYAMSTYESCVVAVQDTIERLGPGLRLEVVEPFFDHPEYIDVLVESAGGYLSEPFDHLLFSYHGLPERHLRKTDPTGAHCLAESDCCETRARAHRTCYRHQVLRTTAKFAERADLPKSKFSVAFQSRLGRDSWLQPYTAQEIERLARGGIKRLLVICPAFVTDCLETLEEIGIGGREIFLRAGGEEFELIPCLNDHPRWMDVVTRWCSGSATRLGGEVSSSS